MDLYDPVDALGIGRRWPAIPCSSPDEYMESAVAVGPAAQLPVTEYARRAPPRAVEADHGAVEEPCVWLTRDVAGRRRTHLRPRSQVTLRQRDSRQCHFLGACHSRDRLAQVLVLRRHLAEHTLQQAHLVPECATLASRNHPTVCAGGGQGAASRMPAPAQQLVRCQPVHARHTRNAAPGRKAASTLRSFSPGVQRLQR